MTIAASTMLKVLQYSAASTRVLIREYWSNLVVVLECDAGSTGYIWRAFLFPVGCILNQKQDFVSIVFIITYF